MTIRPAIYVGGNFTELVLKNDGANHSVKELTTLDCPTDGLILGVDQILEQAMMKAESIKLIVHGTTLATNAMIKRRRAGGDGQIIEIEHSEGAPFAFLPCSTALNIRPEVAMVALPGDRGGLICLTERH
ncbi:MAG: hydantoinase/oxoprolinase N-terminal domain-containing protein [Pseudomonadota bacterium]|nr:hydantoinase/oxoprolinase N-terminal domain-containing protein [Pseudomonadota bacterium]MEC8550443.1 hydantoinase/oxoprolinase N-terminal domain-containing protein [Pseudomonadota bacterium]